MNEQLLHELQNIKFKKNHDRPNVSGRNDELSTKYKKSYGYPCFSCTFGMIRSRTKQTYQLSVVSNKYPKLYQLLKDYITEISPDFNYTHITLNKNIVCKPHVDKYNTSPSLAIALGEYTGGLLYVKDVPYNIRYSPIIFSGNDLHWTDACDGERYSLIYYCQ